jgi:hypothetical protein
MNDEDFTKFEGDIIDLEELNTTDIKINPDFYIHNIILKGQAALVNVDLKAGMLQFRMCTENLEILCRAAARIPPNYDEDIKAFTSADDYAKETDGGIKGFKLSNKKWQLLLTEVFSSKTLTQAMKL